MRTKYIIHTDTEDYECKEGDLKNWGDIQCSLQRSDYDGVVRSFTSKFEFCNDAYELLFNLYLKDRFMASATIAVYTMNNRWGYDKQFECPLDFSTITWDGTILSINSVDNSLAAIIKANKSTTYELAIGTDIKADNTFMYDRIPMKENITYEFTYGTSYDDSADMLISYTNGDEHIGVGNTGSEICVGRTVDFLDDQEEEKDSYILEAVKDVEVTLDYDIAYKSNEGVVEQTIYLTVCVIHNGSTSVAAVIGNVGYTSLQKTYLGVFTSSDDLTDNHAAEEGVWALVTNNDVNEVWYARYLGYGNQYVWTNTGQTEREFFKTTLKDSVTLDLKAGDKVFIGAQAYGANTANALIMSSSFVFSWMARGDNVNIDVMTPKNVVDTIFAKMQSGTFVHAKLSTFDERLANTYLFASESARGLDGAKLYSSFANFCDWMEAVFGYTYYIGEKTQGRYSKIMECGNYVGTPYTVLDQEYTGDVDTNNIIYITTGNSRFVYLNDGKYYARWTGWEEYNQVSHGHPYTDRLYRFNNRDSVLYCFAEYTDGATLKPEATEFTEDNYNIPEQTVYFVHRTELFHDSIDKKYIESCRDLTFSVDASQIFSTITIGYESQDYDSINGRDEFNFNNTYSTGCNVTDNTLELISKYRADCYGIEFDVEQRGEDTTDSDSDKDVYFALLAKTDTCLIADRTLKIENAYNEYLYNGAFSPMACVRANAAYIGMQAEELSLTFASSEGNSDIVIDGEAMSSNLELNEPMATPTQLEFTTSDVEMPEDYYQLIQLEKNGVTYRGYLTSVDFKYAKEEAAKYKIIVKDIEI
jgi:hypothetical protein